MAQDQDERGAWLVILRGNQPAELRIRTQQPEEPTCNSCHVNLLRLANLPATGHQG